MIQAVLLDIDGTLIDNNALHLLAWQRALRRVGKHIEATAILHRLGMGSDKFAADVLGPDAGDALEKVRTYQGEEYSDKGLIDHAEPLPGAVELLRELKRRGVRTALASSAKPEEADKSLALLGGREAIDELVTSGDVSATKPDPDIFAQALEKLGRPAEALVIGDTIYDIASAHKLGLPCVGVLSGGIERHVLEQAGANAIYTGVAEVLAQLDTVLRMHAHRQASSSS